MSWTADRTEQLRVLLAQGLTFGRIAKIIGNVSRNACIGKAKRMGFTALNRPNGAGDPKPEWRSKLKFAAAETALPPEEPPTMIRVPLAQTTHGQCRYPLWADDLGDRTFPVCGNPVSAGSYCKHHARIVMQPVNTRRAEREPKASDVSEAA